VTETHRLQLSLDEHEVQLVCDALWYYQAGNRGWNDRQAELAGALRTMINKAVVQVWWPHERSPHLPPLPEST
jgi:hypothetical protein